ncbi:prolyl-tRNA synthetase associated domain-containing protein [Enterococcus sp. CSURQ0835]|uniref:prolyl-tRNA synthetase associated domain-containing protein n=1 Tax=Enterococcus sp. CSURQ0835 TaxID=2681394 RepID=UPI00135ADF26|nr:prolyl-tRNA synthetase associated domain-containing protein [Enterococcus sp. CSURQ0835]
MEKQVVYQNLDQLGIAYHVVEHPAVFTVSEIDFVIDGTEVKNLLLKGKTTKKDYLVICRSQQRLDLKKLATQLGEKHLSFASEKRLFDLLGLTKGSVTPLALPCDQQRQITVVIEQAIDRNQKIGFHPNLNTATVVLAFTDFERFLTHYGYQPLYFEN